MRKLGTCTAALLLLPLVFGQQVGQQAPTPTQSPDTAKTAEAPEKSEPAPPKSKPTPTPLTEEQQLGLRILEASEAAARGFEPPMRCYALLQIAGAFATDKTKTASLLRDAFTASVAIQDDDETKGRLQEQILDQLLPISQSDVEERMMQAEPSVRKKLSSAIISADAEKKRFASAIELINRLAAEDEFPYGSGAKLIAALPPSMLGEKQELLADAVSSYSQHKHKGSTVDQLMLEVGQDTLTDLVVRFGFDMSPKLASEAVDEILKQAKEDDESFSVTIGSDTGTVAFTSKYEYQLFALLPLLRRLDESRAKSLLEENQALAAKMKQFPKGLVSLSPMFMGEMPEKGSLSISMNGGGSAQEEGQRSFVNQEWQRKSEEVLRVAEKDPAQAIAQSMTIPASLDENSPDSPRGNVLESIARENLKDHPAVARQALAELRKMASDLPLPSQTVYLSSAADLYLQLGEQDNAEKIVNQGFKLADKVLEKDNDSDDPNKALKAWWPSTDTYRRFLEIETKISHRSTADILQQINDPEIRAIESIIVARTLLGMPMQGFLIAKKTKSGSNMHASGSDPDAFGVSTK